MPLTKLAAEMSKCLSSRGVQMENGYAMILRAFVTSTRPCEKQYIDKETAEKVKEAAEAVTVAIREVRETGQFVKQTVSDNAGKVITEMAKKALEKASKDSDDDDVKEEKGAWQRVKEVMHGKGKDK